MNTYDPDALTFSTFIRCDSTEKAFLAMLAISKQQFTDPFRSIHLHGPTGSGKSRLLKTLSCSLQNQQIPHILINADQIMSDYQKASALGAVDIFQQKYYNHLGGSPILLIDHFDCISGKRVMPKMFEELLYHCPQYVLATNKSWGEMKGLEHTYPLSIEMGQPSNAALSTFARLVFDVLLQHYQNRPSDKAIELIVRMANYDFRTLEGLIKNVCAGIHFDGSHDCSDDAIALALESRIGPLWV